MSAGSSASAAGGAITASENGPSASGASMSRDTSLTTVQARYASSGRCASEWICTSEAPKTSYVKLGAAKRVTGAAPGAPFSTERASRKAISRAIRGGAQVHDQVCADGQELCVHDDHFGSAWVQQNAARRTTPVAHGSNAYDSSLREKRSAIALLRALPARE